MESVESAIRMVGYLLLHHRTSQSSARDRDRYSCSTYSKDATCWCLIGACDVVGKVLNISYHSIIGAIHNLIPYCYNKHYNAQSQTLVDYWDNKLDSNGRRELALQLSQYGNAKYI